MITFFLQHLFGRFWHSKRERSSSCVTDEKGKTDSKICNKKNRSQIQTASKFASFGAVRSAMDGRAENTPLGKTK